MERVLCVCVRDEKSWNIEPNETKSQYLICSSLFDVALENISILFA